MRGIAVDQLTLELHVPRVVEDLAAALAGFAGGRLRK